MGILELPSGQDKGYLIKVAFTKPKGGVRRKESFNGEGMARSNARSNASQTGYLNNRRLLWRNNPADHVRKM